MTVNSSVDWNLKELLCPISTTPAQCNLLFQAWDHWDYWTSELWRVFGYSKWVEADFLSGHELLWVGAAADICHVD